MSRNAQHKVESRSFVSWVLWILGTAFAIYLLAFAVLVLFPGAHQIARAIGLPPDAFETIYYPIFKLLER